MNLAAIDISDHHAPTVSILIGNCVPNRGFVQQFCASAAVSLFAQSHLPRNLGAGHRLADRWSAFGIRVGPDDFIRCYARSAAAKRVQAHRWRRHLGLRCLTVRVSDRIVRHLISTGYLSLESRKAAAAVACALAPEVQRAAPVRSGAKSAAA
jgi:hypothetical protein